MSIELKGRRVLVVGLGRSGLAAARLCLDRGAELTVTDNRPAEKLSSALSELGAGVRQELGFHDQQTFEQAELIVLSPGVPPLPALRAAAVAGVPIIGEIELASSFVEAPIVAITGTNGKSTTTSLAGEMFVAAGIDTFCGGNLGRPLAEAVLAGERALTTPAGRVVLELSSFQLETVSSFSAHVAMLLNLTEDHLDRYPDFAAYRAAKARVFERQGPADFAVVNGDQPECVTLGQRSDAQLLRFGSEPLDAHGAWLTEEALLLQLPADHQRESYDRAALQLAGRHNAHNALAALLACRLAGAPPAACREAMSRFRGLPHRMELVVEVDGVGYYNDSKATNVGSVVGSLSGFSRPVILIAGGKDKGGDYAPLIPVLREVCRHVVLIGAAAEVMAAALGDTIPLHRATTLDEAVRLGRDLAGPGDAVVLSPACSSYDMFDNFEQRGQVFADAARQLGR